MKDINLIIAHNIKRQRSEQGLTLRELADKVGITEATMQKYEANNIRHIDVDMVKRIASALEVPPEEITGWTLSWEIPHEAKKAFETYMQLPTSRRKIVDILINALAKETE